MMPWELVAWHVNPNASGGFDFGIDDASFGPVSDMVTSMNKKVSPYFPIVKIKSTLLVHLLNLICRLHVKAQSRVILTRYDLHRAVLQTALCKSGTCPSSDPPCMCFDIPPTGSNLTCVQQVSVNLHTRQILCHAGPALSVCLRLIARLSLQWASENAMAFGVSTA